MVLFILRITQDFRKSKIVFVQQNMDLTDLTKPPRLMKSENKQKKIHSTKGKAFDRNVGDYQFHFTGLSLRIT